MRCLVQSRASRLLAVRVGTTWTRFPFAGRLSVSATKAGWRSWRELTAAGVEVYSTGGTRRFLVEHGCQARCGGVHRVSGNDAAGKDAAPAILAGFCAAVIMPRISRPPAITASCCSDLVVVNLYPFQQTIAKGGVTPAEAIENIDIGGPSLVRAAAKNHAFTAIATEPGRYPAIVAELKASGGTSLAAPLEGWRRRRSPIRRRMTAIANWFGRAMQPEFSADVAWRAWPDGAAVWRKRPPARRVMPIRKARTARPDYGEAAQWEGAVVQQPARPR